MAPIQPRPRYISGKLLLLPAEHLLRLSETRDPKIFDSLIRETEITRLHQCWIWQCGQKGEFSRFVGFLAQKGGQIFEDGDLWELFKKGGILKNFTKIGKFSYFSTKC